MVDISERVYERLTQKLDWKPWGKIEVVLTDHTDVSNAYAMTLPYNSILIHLVPPAGRSELSNYQNWLEDLFTHELTHVLHLDRYGGIVKPLRWIFGRIVTPNGLTPGWVREGIAVYEESHEGKGRNHSSFSEMMLRTDILNHQFLKIDEATGVKTRWPGPNGAYIYGGAFWNYLTQTYGEEKLTEFIRRYGDSLWLFSLNDKAKKTFEGKTFYALWEDWKKSLEQKYQQVEKQVSADGLTALQERVHQEESILSTPTISPDGKWLVYSKIDLDEKPQLRLFNLETKSDTLLVSDKSTSQISFSPDGSKIVFSSLGNFKKYYFYSDLYEVSLSDKKLKTLTKGLRAADPDYAPDGKSLVYVHTENGSSQLYLYYLESKKQTRLTQAPTNTRFSNPRFSPDGQLIAVSVFSGGKRDLEIYNLKGEKIDQLTSDEAQENEPRWSQRGDSIYFTSDRTGISNIYRIDLHSKKMEQISNVLTGIFAPQPFKNGEIFAQHYFGKGYDLVSFEENSAAALDSAYSSLRASHTGSASTNSASFSSPLGSSTTQSPAQKESSVSENLPREFKIKDYNPFSKFFVPRYVMPGFFIGDGVGIFSAMLGSQDPLAYHQWMGDITYRTDAKFVGGDFIYTYNRYHIPVYFGFTDYVTSYGDLFDTDENFYEARMRGFAGFQYTKKNHRFDFYYTFEHRASESNLPAGAKELLNLGNFAGVGASYQYRKVEKKPASISLEKGPRIRLGVEILDTVLGAGERNEIKILEADVREYLKIPKTKHHVLALRAAGGVNLGDRLFQGVFRLGSDIGEGLLSSTSPRLYPLRGLPQISFAGDRALLFSAEYRLPLYFVDRGLGTTPFFLKDLHLAFFGDLGSVFNHELRWDNFLLGVGGELRADMFLGYGLPVTGRLGYGIIVKGREYLGRLTDPLTGASIKNGVLILQLGTSF